VQTKLIYVAGPYRGVTQEAIKLNIAVAKQVGKLVAQKGWMPVIPHLNTCEFELIAPELKDEFWLEGTMELMRRCWAVVLCPGWQNSSGTLAEIKEAKRLNLTVYETEHHVPKLEALWS
tara:strand:+ start:34829 stop:35185 length:357 start_codon:yes stop_codon:yes gene_type:complete